MLSPSAPPGRSSMSNETFGCSSENAEVKPSVSNTVVSVLSISNDSVTSSPPANSAAAPLSSAGAVVSVDAATGIAMRHRRRHADSADERESPESPTHCPLPLLPSAMSPKV